MDDRDRECTRSRDDLIAEHLHFPRVIARELTQKLDSGVLLDDLIAAGNVGLVEAAERFKPEFGVKFSTFSWPRIRGAMVDDLRMGGRYKRSDVERFRAAEAACEPADVSVRVTTREDQSLGDSAHVAEEIDQRRQIPKLAEALARLPEREREVMRLHYFEGLQLSEVGARMGVHRSWCTRLHQRAIQLLQVELGAVTVAAVVVSA